MSALVQNTYPTGPLLAPSSHTWSTSVACKLDPHFLLCSRTWNSPRGQRDGSTLRPFSSLLEALPRLQHPRTKQRPQGSGCHLLHLCSHFSPDALLSPLECTPQVSISELLTCCSFFGKSPFPSSPSLPSGLSLAPPPKAVPQPLLEGPLPAMLFITPSALSFSGLHTYSPLSKILSLHWPLRQRLSPPAGHELR